MRRPLVLFYILVFYVLLQFGWWAYLLIELNDDVYRNRIELLKNESDPEKRRSQMAVYDKELKKSREMVIGEGAVFLALLLIGIYITNHAFRREEELNRQQRNFLLSVTHEFKSPLAAVKLNLQTIQKRQLGQEQQEDVLRKAIMETERIDTLVEKALMAARLENKKYKLQGERLNLSDLVYRVVSDHIDRRDPVHNIIHHIAPSIYMNGDDVAFSSLLVNLIENAEKYSPPDTTIEIRLVKNDKNDQEAVLTISDQGIGIAVNERIKIFDKFYRIGNEEVRKSKGTGLGLYIVRHVVNLHKGKITVNSNQPSGTIFEMTFPL